MARSWLVFLLLFVVISCTPDSKEQDGHFVIGESLVWPQSPQSPKIRYLYSFRGPDDFGFRPSFFDQIFEVFAGKKNQRMVRPYAIAADDGLIAVTDPGLRVLHLFNLDDEKYSAINEMADQELVSPVGVAYGPDRIYLADSVLRKVFILDRKGAYLGEISGLERPTGLAYHRETNRLFVTDTTGNKIVAFNADGTRLLSFGTRGIANGKFNYPSHITVHGNTLYVNDTMNFKIQAFDIDGNYLFSFGKVGDGSGNFTQPKGVGADSQGNLYVADAMFDNVQIFDDKGRFLLAFGNQGNRAGEFWLPTGIFIIQDKIFVADSYNERVQVFEFVGAES